MIIFILSLIAAIAAGSAVYANSGSVLWTIMWGVLAGFATMMAVNVFFALRLKRLMQQVQEIMTRLQAELQSLINRSQQSRQMTPKMLERRSEEVKKRYLQEALDLLESAKPLFKWSFLIERQVNMNAFVLYYQLGDFEKVDAVMERMFVLDPSIAAMKLARYYQRGEYAKCDTLFRKVEKRFRGDKGVILYATYSWILVKQDRIEDAVEVLARGKEKTGNEGLAKNWEALANNRKNQFSNAFLGESWYGLLLEKPSIPKTRMSKGMMKRNPMFGNKKVRRR